jgi:sporulation protein YlmC with PRC-barrel domain
MQRTLFAALVTIALTAPAAAAQPAPPMQVSGQTSPWRISKVIGVPVYNSQDEQIGTIADLIMDPKARVTTAVISVGGYLGGGDRLIQVPLEVLRFPNMPTTTGSAGNAPERWFPDKAVLSATKVTLESMPPFKY